MNKACIAINISAYLTMTLVCIVVISWQQLWLLLPCALVLNWLYDQKSKADINFRLIYPAAGSAITSALLFATVA